MSKTVGDFIVERLHAWGVRQDLRLSRRRHQRRVRRAEPRRTARSSSSRRATRKWPPSWRRAYAKFTGELGVCIATSGPGASHLLTGLYDARLDHMPVLAIAGQQARTALGGHYQQELDLRQPVQGRRRRFRAAGRARRRRCATSSIARCASPSASGASPPSSCPTTCRRWPTKTRRASTARCIPASATRAPGIVAVRRRSAPRRRGSERRQEGRDPGRRRRAARDRRGDRRRRDSCGAGVAKALLGKAALPDDLPWVTGSIGLLGTKPS